jgi:type II secretory pathway pseudopilin PulG
MTLMELVVALVIVGMMTAAGVAAFQSLIDHRKTVRDASVATERAAALHDMVRGWLAAGTIQLQAGGGPNIGGLGGTAAPTTAASASGSTMNAMTNTAAQGSGDQLVFTTSAPSPAMQANVRIRLYVDIDPNTPEKGLSIEYQTGQATPIQRVMLDSTIDSLDVEFLDRQTGRWFDATQASTIRPRAARVTLMATQAKGVSRLLAVPIVVPIGNTATLTGQGLATGTSGS